MNKDPMFEARTGGQARCAPMIVVDFSIGPVASLLASELALDSRIEGCGVVALLMHQPGKRPMALHVEQSAADLRALSAAAARAADMLDRCGGVQ